VDPSTLDSFWRMRPTERLRSAKSLENGIPGSSFRSRSHGSLEGNGLCSGPGRTEEVLFGADRDDALMMVRLLLRDSWDSTVCFSKANWSCRGMSPCSRNLARSSA